MATGTPVWTQNVSVITPQVLARGTSVRGTLDLRGTPSKWGARVFARQGRGGATALTASSGEAGVDFLIRALDNNGAAGAEHPAAFAARLSSVAAATGNTTVDGDSTAAQNVLNVLATANFANGDLICIQDSGGGIARLEFHRISLITGGASGTLTLDRPLGFTHTAAQLDTVRNKADVYIPIWCPGGTLYEVIFDYGNDTAGESVTVIATAQTYDSDSLA